MTGSRYFLKVFWWFPTLQALDYTQKTHTTCPLHTKPQTDPSKHTPYSKHRISWLPLSSPLNHNLSFSLSSSWCSSRPWWRSRPTYLLLPRWRRFRCSSSLPSTPAASLPRRLHPSPPPQVMRGRDVWPRLALIRFLLEIWDRQTRRGGPKRTK